MQSALVEPVHAPHNESQAVHSVVASKYPVLQEQVLGAAPDPSNSSAQVIQLDPLAVQYWHVQSQADHEESYVPSPQSVNQSPPVVELLGQIEQVLVDPNAAHELDEIIFGKDIATFSKGDISNE